VSLAYAATTDCCTFLLDQDGVCRRVLMANERRGDPTLGGRTRAQAARRCIGAQYVASIDVRVQGGLVPMPRVGTPLLFAYTGDDGRLAVVRTGPLVRFETLDADPVSTQEIHVEWDDSSAANDYADFDDQINTVPLRQSGERSAPRVALFDTREVERERDRVRFRDPDRTAREPWVPPRHRSPAESWANLPATPTVRLQKVNVVAPRESAPTLRMTTPTRRGMLPRRTSRG
jgi:hypothetical protein